MATKIYTVAHLGCANCAAKMEAKMNALTGVEATLTFATCQLRIIADDPDALLPQLQEIVSSIEAEAVITESHEHHAHEESCSCNPKHAHGCHCHGHHDEATIMNTVVKRSRLLQALCCLVSVCSWICWGQCCLEFH